jgi:hypothetical protein
MQKFIITIVVLIILMQCSDDESEFTFAGITETNASGVIIGNIDSSDWGIDENWNEAEQNLFKNLGLSDINNDGQDPGEKDRILKEVDPCYTGGRRSGVCGSVSVKMIYPSFPNPSSLHTSLKFTFDETEVKSFGLLIVDQDLKVMVEIDEFASQFTIDVNANNFSPGKVYRVYYVIKTMYGDFIFKGHGDIKCSVQ